MYPLIHLKHVMSMLSLKLPLCELNTEKAQIKVGGREGRTKVEGGRGSEEKEREEGKGVRGERRREKFVVFTHRTSICR